MPEKDAISEFENYWYNDREEYDCEYFIKIIRRLKSSLGQKYLDEKCQEVQKEFRCEQDKGTREVHLSDLHLQIINDFWLKEKEWWNRQPIRDGYKDKINKKS